MLFLSEMKVETQYILETFFSIYDTNKDKTPVMYGITNKQAKVKIIKLVDDKFFSNRQKLDLNKNLKKIKWLNKEIPLLFSSASDKLYSVDKNNVFTINFDLIASSFYLLSGYHELFTPKDKLNRTLYKHSIQRSLNIIDIPVVNYYFDILKNIIEKAYKVKLNYRKASVDFNFSHDIDYCKTPWTIAGIKNIFKTGLFKNIKLAFKHLKTPNAWCNIEEIISLEKKYNLSSCFYILPENKKYKNFDNADYSVKNIKKHIKFIENNKFKIGIHPSLTCSENSKKLSEEMKRLSEFNVKMSRFHFLMFNIETTPNVLSDNHIEVDNSLGFSEHCGFRNSFACKFKLFDFNNHKISDVYELPLNIMDASFIYPNYMNKNATEAFNIVKQIYSEVKKFNGTLSILWHNNFLSDFMYQEWKDLYIKILKEIYAK